jgi:TetR/AcrR family tetracycline transcriptional repressor
MSTGAAADAEPPRGPGRPRVIDRARIVAAARRLDPETLTMQSLADEIGVGRKTLHYHVKDRDELLRLVSEDTLQEHLSAQATVRTDDWRVAIRAFATSMRVAVIAAGRWVQYARLDGSDAFGHLEPAEAALQSLVAAGFSEETSALALGLAAEFTLTSARDALARQRGPHHPQAEELHRVLGDSADDRFDGLRRLAQLEWDELGSERQFEFDLTVLVYGLERLLAEGD